MTDAPCSHCEDLRAEIDYLRSELGITLEATALAALRATLRLTPNEARIVQALRQAYPRVLSRGQLIDATVRCDREEEVELSLVNVLLSKIRRKLGDGLTENVWGAGHRMTARGVAVVDGAAPPQPRPVKTVSERVR